MCLASSHEVSLVVPDLVSHTLFLMYYREFRLVENEIGRGADVFSCLLIDDAMAGSGCRKKVN